MVHKNTDSGFERSTTFNHKTIKKWIFWRLENYVKKSNV